MKETPETSCVGVRPELIERMGALAAEMDASGEELEAAARDWREIETVLAEAEAELAAGSPTYSADEVFAEARAILEKRIRAAQK